MMFTVDDLHRLRAGHGPIVVAELPQIVADAMGFYVPLVYLSKESLGHINRRHPEVTDFDLITVPLVLRHGLILRETRRQNIYLASHVGL